ncbi:hypothetical protein PTSG_03731 [Salpingoeca rosetta]|uniref:Uncharacterized protein n=1 Tax=Salpingoeca rosetta (strain ATCC 50818 / BSB-021) TaxID=946362 RepID=F2U6F0_SALR5|nr:uncharacterized protein PTSG_03731 [Salpingoeca rosetta]EGD83091.1 hypothetical protein PTSG_03731 [Salpingoeca rosetta]|eukprot:XP_004995455.1 hypothetical protein PTSG_03731 [Salpingoeca rosetta]
MNGGGGGLDEATATAAAKASRKQKLDLSSGFIRHIQYMQRVRNRVEEEWQREQQPERVSKAARQQQIGHPRKPTRRVAQRVKANMPTSQDLRRHRQRELSRNGPSGKLASRAFGALLGGDEKRKRAKPEGPSPASSSSSPSSASTASTATAQQRQTAEAGKARMQQQQQQQQQQQPVQVEAGQSPNMQHAAMSPAARMPTETQPLSTAPAILVVASRPRPIFKLEVELDDNETEVLVVREGDELETVVQDFGLQHHLTDEQIAALTQHLVEEFNKALHHQP